MASTQTAQPVSLPGPFPSPTQIAALSSSLPQSFPAALHSDLAWTGADFSDASKYIHQLTRAQLSEIDGAVHHFKSLGLAGNQVTRETFPLPSLGHVLDQISEEIHGGRGFGLVRGVEASKYSVEDLTLIYLGVQSYIANLRGRQDTKGNMLVHIVENKSNKAAKDHHRHSTKAITFHNEEEGDVVGWLTRGQASEGGSCVIASCYAIYNLLSSTRPDLVAVLAAPTFPFALPRVEVRPVIFFEDGRLIVNFGRTPLMGSAAHPRPGSLPAVTPEQLEALEAVESIAHASELLIKTQPGDMHFINNLAVLHRRDAFANSSQTKRHLVRMRCRSSRLGWTLPRQLQGAWDKAFAPSGPESWNLEPKSDRFFPLRMHPN